MKKCPFCAEDIQDLAIVCKHCDRELVTPDSVPAGPPENPLSTRAKVVLILATAILVVGVVLYSPGGIEGAGTSIVIMILVALLLQYLRRIADNTERMAGHQRNAAAASNRDPGGLISVAPKPSRPKPMGWIPQRVSGWIASAILIGSLISLVATALLMGQRNITFSSHLLFEPREDTDDFSAFAACESFVRDRLKAPSTAGFVSYREALVLGTGLGRYRVRGWVDAENAFGAKLRQSYSCDLLGPTGDNWVLEDLDIGEEQEHLSEFQANVTVPQLGLAMWRLRVAEAERARQVETEREAQRRERIIAAQVMTAAAEQRRKEQREARSAQGWSNPGPDLQLQRWVTVEAQGTELVAKVRVLNKGTGPISARLRVLVRPHSRLAALGVVWQAVSLGPGESSDYEARFPGLASDLPKLAVEAEFH